MEVDRSVGWPGWLVQRQILIRCLLVSPYQCLDWYSSSYLQGWMMYQFTDGFQAARLIRPLCKRRSKFQAKLLKTWTCTSGSDISGTSCLSWRAKQPFCFRVPPYLLSSAGIIYPSCSTVLHPHPNISTWALWSSVLQRLSQCFCFF